MTVFWYVNIPLPGAAEAAGLKSGPGGGWILSQLQQLRGTCRLVVCHMTPRLRQQHSVTVDGVTYLFLPWRKRTMQDDFSRVLKNLSPDIIHVFGTEYAPNCALVRACNGKCVVSIQGLMGECARHYADGLPAKMLRINPLLWLARKICYADSIALEQQAFQRRSEDEKSALRLVKDIIGRTEWDKNQVLKINPTVRYHHVNESLRDVFYTAPTWTYEACEKHSIFVSQGYYPIKGFHMLLETLPRLVKRYPDLRVYVGGQPPYSLNNPLLDKLADMLLEYQRYIKGLIRKNGLQPYIHYTGPLGGEAMKRQYLASNLFLSPSSIENSPNSVGEAMILGVPVVSSAVGGVPSLLSAPKEGLLYPFADTGQMEAHIAAVFDDPSGAQRMGAAAREHALNTHNRQANTQRLLESYHQMQMESSTGPLFGAG